MPKNTPDQNRILAPLPSQERNRLLPDLELVQLGYGQLLWDSGSASEFGYFPTSASVSLLHPMRGVSSKDSAAVGHDGMVGTSFHPGSEPVPA
jgi:hypothetical protein